MAILADGKLELEVTYRGFGHGWVEYGFDCRWDGEPIFNDRPLKRSSSGWASRDVGQMLGSEHQTCCLIPFLNDVLFSHRADFVTPLDPDFTLAIWPKADFPFLPSKNRLIWMSDDYRAGLDRKQTERERAGGILPDDSVQVILAFDAYQYSASSCYQTSGPALHMLPTWGALREFAESLHDEFRRFAGEHDLWGKIAALDELGFGSDKNERWWRQVLFDDGWKIGEGAAFGAGEETIPDPDRYAPGT